MSRFSVSGLFQKVTVNHNATDIFNDLQVLVTDAENKEEAFGKFLLQDVPQELSKKGYSLAVKIILEIV